MDFPIVAQHKYDTNNPLLDLNPFNFDVEFSKFINLKGRFSPNKFHAFINDYVGNEIDAITQYLDIYANDLIKPQDVIDETIPSLNSILAFLRNIPGRYIPNHSQLFLDIRYVDNELDLLRLRILNFIHGMNLDEAGAVMMKGREIQEYLNEKIFPQFALEA